MAMETTLDFTRWTEKPLGVAYRRWVIASTGMRQLFATKFFRGLLLVAWTAGLLMAVAGFLFSQSVATGGWLETFAARLGPRPEAIVSAFCAFVLLYPDIIVRGLYTMIFWGHASLGLGLSLVALTAVVPRLVTRDRASNALTIYLARPLTSLDYLLGKFGIILGILLVVWTGPLLFGWILSVLFAPDRVFIVYSLVPLGRALLFNLVGLVVLAAIALGVSSATKTARNTTLLWIGLWIVAGAIANIPTTPGWVRHASFSYDLRQLRGEIFRPDEVLAEAAKSLPMMDRNVTDNLSEASRVLETESVTGPAVGLAVLVGLSCVVFFRRLRPE